MKKEKFIQISSSEDENAVTITGLTDRGRVFWTRVGHEDPKPTWWEIKLPF